MKNEVREVLGGEKEKKRKKERNREKDRQIIKRDKERE